MISKISGRIVRVNQESIELSIGPFEFEVLIADFVRRQLQSELEKEVSLFTIAYMDGNPMQGQLTPRIIGFQTEIEREFFDLFRSVQGVGVKKALRAMVRPVQEVAEAIEKRDVKGLSLLPGIGPATAERIVAKLRRKVPKFALLVSQDFADSVDTPRDVVEVAYETLIALGHLPAEAQKMVESVPKKKYKDVQNLLEAVYQQKNK